MESQETYQGAQIDTRPESEKAKDYRFEEIVASAAPVVWKEKKESEFRKFPIFDQGRSGSCVAQTGKKQLGVYIQQKTGAFIPLSASHIYKRRFNKPAGGMNGNDVFQIMKKGTTLAQFAPDEKMSDSQMDAVDVNSFEEKIGEAFKIGSYMVVGTKDIDLIASIIQETGKAVMVWFYFKHDEWTERPKVKYPTLDLYASSTARHSVAAVDFTLTKDGKKALVIDDSWGPSAGNGAGQRIIDEDFYNARNWYAAHFMNFEFEDQSIPTPTPITGKPKYNFTKDLECIPSAPVTYNAPDVVALQNCLKWEGCFPSNSQSTGYFGSVTKASVGKFQVKHGIAGPADAGFGRCGPKTRAKLNQLFA